MNQKEKVKARLTALDINALVTEMKQKLIGMRVSNIYNEDQKTFIFKFSKSEQKEFLIIENGVRFNLTDESGFQKSKMPSGFTMKFRKFLRSRRIEAIEQIGIERVVVLTFGVEQHAQYLILELYSQGNIILADKDFRIVQLTRQHQFSENAKVVPGEIYPFEYTATNYIEKFDTSEQHIKELINKQQQKQEQQTQPQPESKNQKKGKKQQQQQQQSAQMKLKELVFKVLPCFHQQLVDDMIVQYGMNANEKVSEENLEKIKPLIDYCYNYLVNFCKKTSHKGYLVAPAKYLNMVDEQQQQPQQLEGQNAEEQPKEGEKKPKENKIKYFDFVPDLASFHKGKYIEETPNFNSAVDKYFKEFDRTEEQPNIEDIAWKKFENIKNDQLNRIKKLQEEQDEYTGKARLIEENIQDIQAILEIIQKMVDGGLHWDKIAKMISESKKEGDPLANMIHDMDVRNNKITVLVGDEESTEELTPIDLDLRLSAYQNSRKYFENKKKHGQKEKKTKEAADQALKQAEKQAVKEIEKENIKQMKVFNARKKYWFEKFYWFISTDGFLVISGKDVQQNELVVKKYLDKNDLYMHADMYGSTSTVIKNPDNKTIPDTTLMQAATATICRSKAWDSKIVVSAWWVYSHQVSKSAPAGLYVGAGSFMIYGKKNFIHPSRLEMGYTLLFALDQESIAKHAQERKQKLECQSELLTQKQDDFENEQSEITEKNVFDTDEEDQEDQNQEQNEEFDGQSEVKSVKLTQEQLRNIGQVGVDEVTILEVNPNARLIQEKNQLKQQQKSQQQSNQQQGKGDSKQTGKDQKNSVKKEEPESNRQVRGKEKKNKKIKEKYAEQSDEEKELKMQLIGAKQTKDMKKNQQKSEQKQKDLKDLKEQGNDKEQQKTDNAVTQDNQKNWNFKQKKTASITAALLQKQNIEPKFMEEQQQEQQVQKQVEEKEKEEEQPEKLSSEDEPEQKEEEVEKEQETEYQEMQKLVSYLYPDDTYVSLVPMCAPYQVIGNSKYKVKIQPGTLKKGRAAKDIINFFMNNRDASAYEKKLMKQITDEEIVSNLLSGVKITGQGMLQMKQKEKQAKKESNKQKK